MRSVPCRSTAVNNRRTCKPASSLKRAVLFLRVPVELLDSLRDEALKRGCSMNEVATERLGGINKRAHADDVVKENSVSEEESALNIISTQTIELAGKPLTDSDRRAVTEFVQQHGPPKAAAVRAGIAATLIRTQQPYINSVRYFFREILRASTLPDPSNYAEHCVRRLIRERTRRV